MEPDPNCSSLSPLPQFACNLHATWCIDFRRPLLCFDIYPQSGFQRAILWLKDTGILSKLKDDVLNPAIEIPLQKVRKDLPLILSQLGIVFIIHAIGLTFGVLVFLRELI